MSNAAEQRQPHKGEAEFTNTSGRPTTTATARRVPFILDMETSDPDDFLTLLLLLGHPLVQLRAVTVTPGTRDQINLVRRTLHYFQQETSADDAKEIGEILVGAHNIDHDKNCVSAWHYRAFPELFGRRRGDAVSEEEEEESHLHVDDHTNTTTTTTATDNNVPEGWQVLQSAFTPGTVMVEGAAPKNLGALIRNMMKQEDEDEAKRRQKNKQHQQQESGVSVSPCSQQQRCSRLGKLFFQGGFAGEGVVPREKQLTKFKGAVSMPSFNPGGDWKATLSILEHRCWFEDLRFVSKNVCHAVKYDETLHVTVGAALRVLEGKLKEAAASVVTLAEEQQDQQVRLKRQQKSLRLMHQGMSAYLSRKADGKAFHDPLAACCAICNDIGVWADVKKERTPKNEWMCTPLLLLPSSSSIAPPRPNEVKIITDYRPEVFEATLLYGLATGGGAGRDGQQKQQQQQEGVASSSFSSGHRNTIISSTTTTATVTTDESQPEQQQLLQQQQQVVKKKKKSRLQ